MVQRTFRDDETMSLRDRTDIHKGKDGLGLQELHTVVKQGPFSLS